MNRIEIHIPETATELQRERANDLYADIAGKGGAVFLYEGGIYPEHRCIGLDGLNQMRFNLIFEPDNWRKAVEKIDKESKELDDKMGEFQKEISHHESEISRLEDEQEKISEQIDELEGLKQEILND